MGAYRTVTSVQKHIILNHSNMAEAYRAGVNDPNKMYSNPYLYQARVELLNGGDITDEAAFAYGLRTLAWNAQQGFLLKNHPDHFLSSQSL